MKQRRRRLIHPVRLGLIFSILMFTGLALTVDHEPSRFDQNVARLVGQPIEAATPGFSAAFWRDITVLGNGPVVALVVLLVAGYLLASKRLETAAILVGSTFAAAVTGYLLKALFQRPRPNALETLIELDSYSFPSGHSLISGAVYPVLAALLSRIAHGKNERRYTMAAGATLMLLVGVSRIYLGVHYATDVLAGWSVGLAWATLAWTLMSRRPTSPPAP